MTRLDDAVAEMVAAIREEVAAAAAAPAPERLLDIDSAAVALGVSRTTLYGEMRSGRLRAIHIGRRVLIPASAVGDYANGGQRMADA